MKDTMRLHLGLLAAACAGLWAIVSTASAADNLLTDPGFEAVTEEALTKWVKPTYWLGELSVGQGEGRVRDGKHSAHLRATQRDEEHWGRIHSMTTPVSPGLTYRLSVWTKGSGAIKLGVIHYVPKRPGEPHYRTQWMEKARPMDGQWQEVALQFQPVSADVARVAVMIQVEGPEARVYVDDAELRVHRRSAGVLSVSPHYVMLRPGDTARVSVFAQADDDSVRPTAVSVVVSGKEAPQRDLELDGAGRAFHEISVPPDAPLGLSTVRFVQADLGEAATAHVDIVAADLHARFARAAAAVRLGEGAPHMLFLGDSLTDMYRGYNYVDQVGFWLRSAAGSEATVRNAGVGGDFITRLWARLNADPKVYRPSAYEDLYEPKPGRIFIFLGHNDTKLTSSSDFESSVVSPEDFERLYRLAIRKLQNDTGARVTVISSTSSVFEITEPMAMKRLETRGSASLFGKPEVLREYNGIARSLAEELGCTYLDVYEPTRTHPDKRSLFTADGVHVNLEGNHLIALEILRHLGR